MTVRVRIAPSPTGYPHIGTIWQALINFAFAKKHKGKFIVRIEDTDRERFVPDAEKKLFAALNWFGLNPDESPIHPGKYGPYRQSERLNLYQQYAKQLVKQGKAYYCFCSKERLEQLREQQQSSQVPMYDGHCRNLKENEVKAKIQKAEPHVVRLKVPSNRLIIVDDLLRGKIKIASAIVDDQVLLKSDGYPTYHLAVVVDDHLMAITHIVRGEEWISSAPKHVLLYEALGWEQPVFIHTPLLRNPDKSKLSKRQGHTNVSWYQENGYLPQAILNFLSLLGWSHPREKTIFSLAEFIKYFDLKDLSAAGPIVDLKKLDYINGVYIRNTPDDKLIKLLKTINNQQLTIDYKKVIPIVKERISKLSDFNNMVDFFVKDIPYDKELLLKKADVQLVNQQLSLITNHLSLITNWDLPNITKSMQNLCESGEWNRSQFFMVLRVAVTGKTITPPLFESMEILGKDKTLQRIKIALAKVK